MNSEASLLISRWQEILEYMKTTFNISDIMYGTFIKILTVKDVVNNDVYLYVNINTNGPDNEKTIDYIKKFYSDQIKASIQVILQINDDFELFFIPKNDSDIVDNNDKPGLFDDTITETTINSRYTFETFVAGEENAMVYNACIRVAENPGDRYMNPLFIYGNSGLGKTHLMHAIANRILKNDSSKNVLYVTSETFTNEIIEAIRKNKDNSISTKAFRNKYRSVDVLLIDDIQSIIGREAVQSEFFNTFNTLYDLQKQIVLSCDKRPKDLEVLEERIRSRFNAGLPVDVKMPTYETRMAILKQQLDENGITIDNIILDYIATNVSSNIRELQGALNKVIATVKFSPNELTLDVVKEKLEDMITTNTKNNITPEMIINSVCETFSVSKEDILSPKRTNELTEPRHLIMFLMKQYTSLTYANIGNKLGKRDHATVMNGVNKAKDKLNNPSANPDFVDNCNRIKKNLGIRD